MPSPLQLVTKANKQRLANVAGTAEPIYGPSAVRPVGDEVDRSTYTELTRDDLKWQVLETTNVETETFYFVAESGQMGMAQVIYSNVMGVRVTAQFNCKVFSKDPTKEHLWCSTPLNNIEFSEDKASFFAENCALEFSADGNSYTIKSANDERAIVNLKVTKASPGFQGGKTGQTLFGTDLQNPWGTMRHAFWPRCTAEGTITTKEGPIDFKGQAMYSYAIQGMKPHHAAAKWNFVNFQGPKYSAIMMEFTTPESYGNTTVNVGGIVKDGEIIAAGCLNKATHTAVKEDTDNDWPEPKGVRFTWNGKNKEGKAVEGVIEGPIGDRTDRVDVMAEVPGFVKTIVASAAGTKPYIYQYTPKMTLKLKIGDETIEEEGQVFMEATFIVQ
ncbi:Survival factor-like protein [Emericellopsis cladophorae]|uniref:Survival factor-like protein n=1 Tax=Emericellopsis cladophorae TaxID=2686198 RepID=A0A9P9Y8V0_9HYPO|nr:Survival factor-like protein [Emericellopsis cladophorae]KAI6785425.1 Survival factor-like protein [Emericellopsis cladophorae]